VLRERVEQVRTRRERARQGEVAFPTSLTSSPSGPALSASGVGLLFGSKLTRSSSSPPWAAS